MLFFVANALLRLVWAHRLFGYCAIIMASVPNDARDPRALPVAMQAAEINITAAKSFNPGLRCVYFALGALGWLAGPTGLFPGAGYVLFIRLAARIRLRLVPRNHAAAAPRAGTATRPGPARPARRVTAPLPPAPRNASPSRR